MNHHKKGDAGPHVGAEGAAGHLIYNVMGEIIKAV